MPAARRVRRAVGHANKGQRAVERRALGRLQDGLIQPYTKVRYSAAVLTFFQWVAAGRLAFPTTFALLDYLVCEFVEHLWYDGESKSGAADVLSALAFFLPLPPFPIPLASRRNA